MGIASEIVPEEPEACQLGKKGTRYAMEGMKEDIVATSKSEGGNKEP